MTKQTEDQQFAEIRNLWGEDGNTPQNRLANVLVLAVVADTEDGAQDALDIASDLSSGMTADQVEQARQLAESILGFLREDD